MLLLVLLVLLCWLAPLGCRLIANMVATVIGVIIVARGNRAARAIRALRAARGQGLAQSDPKASRAERRALAASLRAAVRQAAFASLFPDVIRRGQRIVAAWERERERHAG